MSMNKFMHPRNIYRKPPDFKELAIVYPDFRRVTKTDLSGKIKFDFKDEESLRILTRTLLQKDFNLDVTLPVNTLVPTLPLRLNYILWIEDLLSNLHKTGPVYGIDIGTGASCIYPLLAARKGWNMLATEVDPSNAQWALKNVNKNSLDDLVSVKLIENSEQILISSLNDDIVYDFCMCNPPFFSTVSDLNFNEKSRKPDRTEPRNATTGNLSEVTIQGGEQEFIKKLINESKILSTRVQIFTTMIGIKSSLNNLKKELEKVHPTSVTTTMFCQGHTMRWGLAWTFLNVNIDGNVYIPNTKKKKLKPPFIYKIPHESSKISFQDALNRIKLILQELQVLIEEQQSEDLTPSFLIKAFTNTWSNQRRKRREAKKFDQANCSSKEENENMTGTLLGKRHGDLINQDDVPTLKKLKEESLELNINEVNNQKKPILEILLVLKDNDGIILELSYLSGELGRDAVHQILQYIKNKWETT